MAKKFKGFKMSVEKGDMYAKLEGEFDLVEMYFMFKMMFEFQNYIADSIKKGLQESGGTYEELVKEAKRVLKSCETEHN